MFLIETLDNNLSLTTESVRANSAPYFGIVLKINWNKIFDTIVIVLVIECCVVTTLVLI